MSIVTLPFTIANGQLIDANPVTGNFNALALAINTLVVPLTGPATLTGPFTFSTGPQVPTQSPGDNTTNAASTAFVQTAVSSIGTGSASFRNKILNNAMQIDQRGNGPSVGAIPTTGLYVIDRWQFVATQASKYTAYRVGTPPGFSGNPPLNYDAWLSFAVSTALASPATSDNFYLLQTIEADLIRDLNFGTASASPVTLSFWVQTNVTGSHSGVLANDNRSRCYPFTFTVSAANTWTFITVTIPGDTGGTWNNGYPFPTNAGMVLNFNLGAGATFLGTAGAWGTSNVVGATGSVQLVTTINNAITFTGVRLEKGNAATTDDVFPLSIVLEMCQRYYEKSFASATKPAQNVGLTIGGLFEANLYTGGFNPKILGMVKYSVQKRVVGTITLYNPQAANAQIRDLDAGADFTASTVSPSGGSPPSEYGFGIFGNPPGGFSTGDRVGVHWTSDAEF